MSRKSKSKGAKAMDQTCDDFGIDRLGGFLSEFDDDKKSDSYLFGWYWFLSDLDIDKLDFTGTTLDYLDKEFVKQGFEDCKATKDQV